VDAHVHLQPEHAVGRILDAASRNLERVAAALGTRAPWDAIVVLTETEGVDRFAELLGRAGPPGRDGGPAEPHGDGLVIQPTREETSVRVAVGAGAPTLGVIAGRQVQTAEGLEVLVFPTRGRLCDGDGVRTVLTDAATAGCVGVIPWGFGKWTLRRGALLRDLLGERASGSVDFFLGDTGHRPSWAHGPRPLRTTGAGERPVLTGSDPFPLRGQEDRVGACAFEIEGPFEAERPAACLLAALQAKRGPVRRLERRAGLIDFVTTQLAMQLRKRVRR